MVYRIWTNIERDSESAIYVYMNGPNNKRPGMWLKLASLKAAVKFEYAPASTQLPGTYGGRKFDRNLTET